MKYIKCGNSGILLPKISLGLWHNFGEKDNQEEAQSMIRYAFDQGVCHFDLANNYGPPPGSAESFMGKMMKGEMATHRHEMFISTKAGHKMWEGPYGDGGSRKMLITSIDQSLKRMNLDYVDLFYNHRYDANTPLDETLQTLVDIVKQGKALYIGLSKYPIDKLIYALDFLRKANTPCLIYQDKYNMFVRKVEVNHLHTVEQYGAGFISFSPLAQGLLTNKYLHGIPQGSRADRVDGFLKKEEVTAEIVKKATLLNEIAMQRGETLAQMALAWQIQNPKVTSLIVGASSVAQLKTNLTAIDSPTITTEQQQAIEKILSI